MELKAVVIISTLFCAMRSLMGHHRKGTNRGDPRSALGYLDLGYLLSLAGPYGMFRDYLTKTE
jgi:hypothetical protein